MESDQNPTDAIAINPIKKLTVNRRFKRLRSRMARTSSFLTARFDLWITVCLLLRLNPSPGVLKSLTILLHLRFGRGCQGL